jgi:pimeloyl-ACP methyl ester carboxylesterase
MTEALSFVIRGTGPGLVGIHGRGSTGRDTWATLLDQLAAKHTVVLPDLPGSGDSPLPDGPLNLDVVADQIVATADAAGLGDFVVAGVSLGSPIGVRVATRHPDRVHAFISIVGFAHARSTLKLILEVNAAMYEQGFDEVTKFLISIAFSERYLAGLSREAVDQMIAQLSKEVPGALQQTELAHDLDVRDDLAKVRCPSLIITAAEDRFVAPEHSVELADGIPQARLVEVNGGHGAIFEDPQPTAAAVLEFLEELQ